MDKHQMRVHKLLMADDRAQRFSSAELFHPGVRSRSEGQGPGQQGHHDLGDLVF